MTRWERLSPGSDYKQFCDRKPITALGGFTQLDSFTLFNFFQFRVKLTIVCSDNGVPSLSAEQLVTVNIIQIEDPPQIVLTPVFGNPDDASGLISLFHWIRPICFLASMVMENSKKGTFVSWLRITNRKSSDDLTIMLSPAEYFKLNSDVIVTTRAFDREKKAMFNLKVTVCETTRRIHRYKTTTTTPRDRERKPLAFRLLSWISNHFFL